jgi:hypothetical protein
MPATWFSGLDVVDILKTLQVWPDDADMQALFSAQADAGAEAMKAEFETLTAATST